MGRYSDIYGRKPFLILSLIGSCFGSILQGSSRNMVAFIIFRSLTGLFAGSLILVQTMIADLVVPEERSVWLTRLESFNSIAYIIGPALGGLIATISYRMPLYRLLSLFHSKFRFRRSVRYCSNYRHLPLAGVQSSCSCKERGNGGKVEGCTVF